MNDAMKLCIESCTECSRVCTQTMMHCLREGDKHAEPSHIRLLIDCAEVCKLSAALMARESDYASKLCVLCAEICDACAVSCDSIPDDEQMQKCAETCRACARDCRAMA